MVTGCERWYLGVLILGVGFKSFVIERDEGEIEALRQSEEAFWEYVQTNTPPLIDGSDSTSKTIQVIQPESNGEEVSLVSLESDLQQYKHLSSLEEDYKKMKNEVANRIKVYMQDASIGKSNSFKVSYSSYVKSTFDHKAFAKDNPDIDLSGYFKSSVVRPFKVSSLEE